MSVCVHGRVRGKRKGIMYRCNLLVLYDVRIVINMKYTLYIIKKKKITKPT